MSNFKMRLEVRSGAGIETTITEAKELVEEFGILSVLFKFNGIEFSISKRSDVKKALKEYYKDNTYDNKGIKDIKLITGL